MEGGRTVVVTGAGSGLGQAMALRFARGGDYVLLVGRTQAKLEETAGLIDGPCATAALDIAEAGAMEAALEKLVAERGGLQVLVANAGINPQRADALATTNANWEETLRVHRLAEQPAAAPQPA